MFPLSRVLDLHDNGARREEDGGHRPPKGLDREGNQDGRLAELYADLRQRAGRYMRRQPRDQTLQTTALVHEACLKIFGRERLESPDRSHLLALASSAMRSVLVDHARARGRAKRLPLGERLPIDEIAAAYEDRGEDLIALDEALTRLAAFDPLMSRAVDLHFFGGLSLEDTAEAVGLSLRTLERRWALTRAWLKVEIG
jgi:RNA polymerase sigma factor (TIGR02999 family)